MATHSSVLAWRIPGMGEPGGLQSMGSLRVGTLLPGAFLYQGWIRSSEGHQKPRSHLEPFRKVQGHILAQSGYYRLR